MGLHLAIVSPLDAARLARELELRPPAGTAIPEGHGGHPVNEPVLAVRQRVDSLDLVTLDPRLRPPLRLAGDGVRLAVGLFRPRARARGLDLFADERRFVADRLSMWRPEVVSARWTYEYALGALDSVAPTLVTVQDWAPPTLRYQRDRYRAVRLLMQRLTLRRGSDLGAVSPFKAQRVERHIGRPVTVVPNLLGADWFERPTEQLRQPAALAVNNGFGARKNVRTLLRAWPRVRAQMPQATFGWPVSATSQAAQHSGGRSLRAWTRTSSSSAPNPRHELASWLHHSSDFVHPSREESFGMTVLEAMATATPVIGGRRSGAFPWLLEDGAGQAVDIDSADDIADSVLAILRDPLHATTVGERGRSRALRAFAAQPVASAYLERLARVRTSA